MNIFLMFLAKVFDLSVTIYRKIKHYCHSCDHISLTTDIGLPGNFSVSGIIAKEQFPGQYFIRGGSTF